MKKKYTFTIEYNKLNGNWSAECNEDPTIIASGHKKKKRGALKYDTDVYPRLCETIIVVKDIEIVMKPFKISKDITKK